MDVSIVIPSYNRGALVRQTVERCLHLRPAPREIVLVDDHSDVESEHILRSLESELVKYIRLPENRGQAMARSVGFASARGKYIVSLDDDSWFLDEDGLERVCHQFRSLSNCGILAFQTLSPQRAAAAADRLTIVSDHITCGAAYRADLLHKTGYHVPFLRFAGEEADLSIKAIAEGFDVVRDESIRVFHDYDPTRRSRQSLIRVRRFCVRNDLLQAWIYFPVDVAIGLTLWRSLSHLVYGIRNGYFMVTLRAYAEFIFRLPQALFHRRPIGRGAALKYLRLRRQPEVVTNL